jgi:beta-lactamase regulating signal transducer with metallopeptidase domain
VAEDGTVGRVCGALLKIAAARIEPDLAPAPLFLKRRHLRERVDALVKGAHMTKSRLVLSMFAVLMIVPVIAGLIAWQLPLRAAAQSNPPDSAGVEVRTGRSRCCIVPR